MTFKISRKRIALLIAVILPAASVLYVWYSVYSYGAEGRLDLDASIDRLAITTNESLTLTINLTNIGNTKLRILPFTFGSLSIALFDSSGNYVRYKLPVPTYRTVVDEDLMVLDPGKRITTRVVIDNRSWDLVNNDIYTIRVAYRIHDLRVSYPHWEGTIWAEPLTFQKTSVIERPILGIPFSRQS